MSLSSCEILKIRWSERHKLLEYSIEYMKLIPVIGRTLKVCGRSIAGIAGSNLAEGMDVLSGVCCVLCI